MNIDIITKAIEIYLSENSLSYGFNISGDIDESNYSENVEWNNGLDADSKGIPMEAPITWSDLQAYITKANTAIASIKTREQIKTAVEAKGYKYFEESDWNVNIIGIRNSETKVKLQTSLTT